MPNCIKTDREERGANGELTYSCFYMRKKRKASFCPRSRKDSGTFSEEEEDDETLRFRRVGEHSMTILMILAREERP